MAKGLLLLVALVVPFVLGLASWEAGIRWTVNQHVSGVMGGSTTFSTPAGEEIEVWPLSYPSPSAGERPFLQVLYYLAYGVEVEERWDIPCCYGTRRLVDRGP